MIGAGTQGWAITLADLCIILFLITSADLSNAEIAKSALDKGDAAAIATADPVAIYRPGPTPLRAWLESQQADPRQRITVVVHHDGTHTAQALAQGAKLAEEAEKAGHQPRVIVEQSAHPDVAVMLTYDTDAKSVARKLLSPGQTNQTENAR